MKHGPIALIDERVPVVALAPDDHVFEKMLGNMQEAKARGGVVIAVTTHRRVEMVREVLGAGDEIVSVPDTHPLLSPSCWSCRCSCWPTTSPCAAGATSTSRGISPRASRSNRRRL